MNREKAETEARAKIFWGESRESVIDYLRKQGLSVEDATLLTESACLERAADVRACGFRKIFTGTLLILVPIIAYVVFQALGFLPLKLFGVTVAVGIYGGWRLISGSVAVLFPKHEHGDLSDKAD